MLQQCRENDQNCQQLMVPTVLQGRKNAPMVTVSRLGRSDKTTPEQLHQETEYIPSAHGNLMSHTMWTSMVHWNVGTENKHMGSEG